MRSTIKKVFFLALEIVKKKNQTYPKQFTFFSPNIFLLFTWTSLLSLFCMISVKSTPAMFWISQWRQSHHQKCYVLNNPLWSAQCWSSSVIISSLFGAEVAPIDSVSHWCGPWRSHVGRRRKCEHKHKNKKWPQRLCHVATRCWSSDSLINWWLVSSFKSRGFISLLAWSIKVCVNTGGGKTSAMILRIYDGLKGQFETIWSLILLQWQRLLTSGKHSW